MTELEYHVIRTTTTIKSVNLAVRFPCSLTFQLKDGTHSLNKTTMLLMGGDHTSSRLVFVSQMKSSMLMWMFFLEMASMLIKK